MGHHDSSTLMLVNLRIIHCYTHLYITLLRFTKHPLTRTETNSPTETNCHQTGHAKIPLIQVPSHSATLAPDHWTFCHWRTRQIMSDLGTLFFLYPSLLLGFSCLWLLLCSSLAYCVHWIDKVTGICCFLFLGKGMPLLLFFFSSEGLFAAMKSSVSDKPEVLWYVLSFE